MEQKHCQMEDTLDPSLKDKQMFMRQRAGCTLRKGILEQIGLIAVLRFDKEDQRHRLRGFHCSDSGLTSGLTDQKKAQTATLHSVVRNWG